MKLFRTQTVGDRTSVPISFVIQSSTCHYTLSVLSLNDIARMSHAAMLERMMVTATPEEETKSPVTQTSYAHEFAAMRTELLQLKTLIGSLPTHNESEAVNPPVPTYNSCGLPHTPLIPSITTTVNGNSIDDGIEDVDKREDGELAKKTGSNPQLTCVGWYCSSCAAISPLDQLRLDLIVTLSIIVEIYCIPIFLLMFLYYLFLLIVCIFFRKERLRSDCCHRNVF